LKTVTSENTPELLLVFHPQHFVPDEEGKNVVRSFEAVGSGSDFKDLLYESQPVT
jgi:hypothetical protein